MRTVLLIGMLAACLVVCYARYKSSDFTDAGENYSVIWQLVIMLLYICAYSVKMHCPI